MQPLQLPEPPRPKGNVKWPLLLTIGLMLLLYLVASSLADGRRAETAYAYFFAMIGLFILNVAGGIIAAIAGRSQTALGFVYAALLTFLIGLGACAFTLTHFGGE